MKTQFEGYTEETTKPRRGRVRMKDFYALFAPTGEPWPTVSIEADCRPSRYMTRTASQSLV